MPIKVSQQPEYAVLANLLAEVRERAGISQNELARRMKRRQVIVWRFENALQSPDLIELALIAKILNVDFLELISTWKQRCDELQG